MSAANATVQFLGAFQGASLHLSDIHGLWGGRGLRLTANGRGMWLGVIPNCPARLIPFNLSPAETQAIFDLCVTSNFVTWHLPAPVTLLPDTVSTTLTLRNAQGAQITHTHWAFQPMPSGFSALSDLLMEVERLARAQSKDNDLPYDAAFSDWPT